MKPINYDEKKKILIVDDETDVSLALKMALEGNNFEVDAFNEALLGLENFTKGLYDLLKLDIKMPKLYREIKKKTIK
jgi:DNA-binding response OmpR family regulator